MTASENAFSAIVEDETSTTRDDLKTEMEGCEGNLSGPSGTVIDTSAPQVTLSVPGEEDIIRV